MPNKIVKILWYLGGTIVAGIVFSISVLMYFSFGLPKISTLADYNPPIPSKILSKDGVVLAEIGMEKRTVVDFDKIPKRIVDAFLAAEDSGFYDHNGVDYWGVMRAMFVNIKAGRVVQGGSTITQQVAKSLLLSRERSISRKIKDFLLAQKIEEKFTKEEILYLYLNQVYLGGGYYGIVEAFRGYFDKPLEDATIAESAMIAGLLVAPGKYSPYIHPDFAYKRQRYVLKRMLATSKISQDEYNLAMQEVIKFRLRKKSLFKAGYFTDWVRQRVIGLVGEKQFLTGGFVVETTLDYELQKTAEKSISEGVKRIDKRQGFKGSLGNLEDPEKQKEIEIKFRKDTYKKRSNYFTIKDDYSRKYELEFDAEKYELIKAEAEEWNANNRNKPFRKGYNAEDPLLSFIQEEESYKATVKAIDDDARLVYISIGGIEGVIPYDGFKWAHERQISENRTFFPYVTKPSSILSVGDIILAQVKSKEATIDQVIHKGVLKRYKKKRSYKFSSSEKYLLCNLDQHADVQGALVAMDPLTGEIQSFVGGADFSLTQFNRAVQSLRQPGSSFKPFLFAAALERGYTPTSIIIDSPEALGGADQGLNWKPRNYDNLYKGPMTFRNSLELSRNIPTIKIADKIGVKNILSFMDRICLDAKLQEDLSLSLGSFGVTLLDIVSAYAIFPNGGQVVDYKSVYSIKDRFGNLYQINENVKEQLINERMSLEEIEAEPTIEPELATNETGSGESTETKKPEVKKNDFISMLSGKQAYDKRLAYIMTNLLRGVVLHGTGRRAKVVSSFLGGKTGTTSNYVDAWFLGFSPKLVTGVWTGFDENQTLGWGETGTKAALPIWIDYMKASVKKSGETDFSVPEGIVNVTINKSTGKLAMASDKDSFVESFVEGTEPGELKDEIVEPGDDAVININNQDFGDDDYYDNQ